jgi:aminobenzoyl-glutamate utilization protein B
MAQGATLMTNTSSTSRVLGSAWPGHFNKPLAEAMGENMMKVGMPEWSADDQKLARAIQKELKSKEEGLPSKPDGAKGPSDATNAGSDDIGDISWNVPTVVLRYPSNVPGLPGHNWANAIAMATPIAHKGAVAGAKVQAMTILDLLTRPDLITKSWDYFRDVQTKDTKYVPIIRPGDQPAIFLNRKIMEEYRPRQSKFYYDSSKYKSYLEQLGIKYPTVRE